MQDDAVLVLFRLKDPAVEDLRRWEGFESEKPLTY
jgi:hypothetical protein